jgi:hypothetical protein
MTFYEQHNGIWVCDDCNGALSEETLRGIERVGMLERCPRCGAAADGTVIEAYPDDESVGLIDRLQAVTERFK